MLPTVMIETGMVVVFSYWLEMPEIPSSLIHVSEMIKQTWAHIHKDHKQSIILGPVYCPPECPPSSPSTVLDQLKDTISDIKNSHPTAKLLLGGDFNCPGIEWHHKTLDSYVPVSLRVKLLEVAEDFHFEQLVTTPTRGLTS